MGSRGKSDRKLPTRFSRGYWPALMQTKFKLNSISTNTATAIDTRVLTARIHTTRSTNVREIRWENWCGSSVVWKCRWEGIML